MRVLALDTQWFDLEAYHWILTQARPNDLFVTEPDSPDHARAMSQQAATFSVMAAGRRLVVAPEVHSNPYVGWEERNVRRIRYFDAFTAPAAGYDRALCDLVAETGKGATGYFLLSNDVTIESDLAEPVFHSNDHTIYRVRPRNCRGD